MKALCILFDKTDLCPVWIYWSGMSTGSQPVS